MVYDIVVRNEHTGDAILVCVGAASVSLAQNLALIHLFRTEGWRKAVALQPLCALAFTGEGMTGDACILQTVPYRCEPVDMEHGGEEAVA